MASALIAYDDWVDISPTADNAWHTVTLSLRHSDPKGVLVRKVGCTGNCNLGARATGSAQTGIAVKNSIFLNEHHEAWVPLNGSNQIDLLRQNDDGKIYLETEVGGDDVYINPSPTSTDYTANSVGNGWATDSCGTDLDGTTFDGSQCGVLLNSYTKDEEEWDYREAGSAYATLINTGHGAKNVVGVVQLNADNEWENYVSLKDGVKQAAAYRIGYIKNWKGHDPAEETWSAVTAEKVSITNPNLDGGGTGSFPDGAIAFIQLTNNFAQLWTQMVRSNGSTNTWYKMYQGMNGMMCNLDRSQQLWRNKQHATLQKMWVRGYYDATPAIKIDGQQVVIDGKQVIVDSN